MNELLRELLSLPEQASTFARDVDELHYFVISVTMVGWLLVTILTLYFVFRYRRRSETQTTRRIIAPLWLELGLAGMMLSFFLTWWVIGYRQYVNIRVPPPQAMEIYVTAKQWMWKFAYPNGRSSLSILTVPTGRPVKLLMTSQDVIHSFSVPAFRVKMDVLPGRYTLAWFEATTPGTYQLLCAEYCGLGHSRMWGEVVVLSAEDYEAWLQETVASDVEQTALAEAAGATVTHAAGVRARVPVGIASELARLGRDAAVRYGCFGCHTVDGRRHIGPTWRNLFGTRETLADGTLVQVDEEYLTQSMMDPRAKMVRGFQAVMPSFQGILPPSEAAAIIEFIKSLRESGAATAPPHPPAPQFPTEFMQPPPQPEAPPPFEPPERRP